MSKPPPIRLLNDLEQLLGPSAFTRDPLEMAPWLSDWRGRFIGRAAAMVAPACTAEVQAIVQRCAAEGVALVPQGGNTSLVGGATPDEAGCSLLLSLRRMKAIRSLSQQDNVVVAEAGVILSDLHDAAAGAGRRFPLSLGAKGSATIGGLISTNAGGTQVLRFGAMRSLVLGLEAVLPDGSLCEGLSALRKDNRGYDLKHLLIGAEGTLGVITAASLRLVPAPGSTGTAWVGLDSPAGALELLRSLEARLGETIESFELVPDDLLALVLEKIPGVRRPLGTRHAWNVLIEAVAPQSAGEARATLADELASLLEDGLLADAVVAGNARESAELWRLRDSIAEAERLDGPTAKHDVSVPVSDLPAFIEEARLAVAAAFPGSRAIVFGHLGDGNVHFNVRPPRGPNPDGWVASRGGEVTRLIHDLVVTHGGSISAEHGIGQLKLAELVRTCPPGRMKAQLALKRAIDPHGIMNPGKLLAIE